MNVVKFRDSMVFMVTSITKMLGTASWSVFLIDSRVEKLKEKYESIEKLNDALCGYVVDYYYDGENSKQIELIPTLLDGGVAIFVALGEQVAVVSYDLNKEHDSMVVVHEQVKALLAEYLSKNKQSSAEKRYIMELYEYIDLEDCNSLAPDEKPIKIVECDSPALSYEFEKWLETYEGWKYRIVDENKNVIVSGVMDPNDIDDIRLEVWTALVGKVIDLTIYDCGTGMCEVLEADTRGVTVQWITQTTCYSCQSVERDFYAEPKIISYDLIAEFGNARNMSKEEVEAARNEDIYYSCEQSM